MNDDEYIDVEGQRRALEAFVVNNPELEQLEALLGQFNLFEAIGAVRTELRHSDFLAFLLDPSQNHGLGDAFLKRLLQKTLLYADDDLTGVSPIEIDVWDLGNTEVRREWQHIDILLLNETHKLVVIIENKIDSREHSKQLQRYWAAVQKRFEHHQLVPIYLTPEGDEPSDEAYILLDYTFVSEVIEDILETRRSTLETDVVTTISHYVQMLRRFIVSDSEIAKLAAQIYKKHRRAMEILIEHQPNRQSELADRLTGLVSNTHSLMLDSSTRRVIRFCPAAWDNIVALKRGEGWTPSNRIVLFQFDNDPDRLTLKLIIGPGDLSVRQHIFDYSQAHPELFGGRGVRSALGRRWATIWTRDFLGRRDYDDSDVDDLMEKVQKMWDRLADNELPALMKAIEQIDFSGTESDL